MSKFYGPYYMDENEIWHWHTECPDFPKHPNPKMMVSSSYPDKIELCDSCAKIDAEGTQEEMLKNKK